ncbi:hypothetical protein VTP01DRAFT_9245 [Rhizomucor pusillus]|uniref:uncharacterized protein n=1 Tax=Rhizomucor pusillus TaxID=4840 RepID=UPI003742CA72
MSAHEEEKTEQKYSDTSTAIEDETQGSSKEVSQISKAERKLVRKINIIFLPFVLCIGMLQTADKSALAISGVLGIYQDTGITGSQFSWLGSIFFLGYLLYQIPNQFFVQWFLIRRYLGTCITLWGGVMLFTALGRTFSQLAALRFLLGFFEAANLPCIYVIIANLYRRREHPYYFSFATMSQGVGAALGNLVAAGVSTMGNRGGIPMWRWNHIIFGALTVALGILTCFFLVDNPRSKLLRLTPEEMHIVDLRTQDNAFVRNKRFNPKHITEALGELRYYLIILGMIGVNMQAGGILVFSVQLIQVMGNFTATESILFKIPGGAATFLTTLMAGLIARRTQQTVYTGIFMCLISLSGCLVLACIPSGTVKLLGYYLSLAAFGSSAMFATIVGSNVSGYSKKIFYNTTMTAANTLGQFIGPLVMLDREKPRYLTGLIVFSVGNAVAIVCLVIIRIMIARENKRRIASPPPEIYDVNLDLTDQEDRNFLYKV